VHGRAIEVSELCTAKAERWWYCSLDVRLYSI
jgi:hypothetical protein